MLLANWLSGAVLGECKLSYENDVFMSWCNLRSRSILANVSAGKISSPSNKWFRSYDCWKLEMKSVLVSVQR